VSVENQAPDAAPAQPIVTPELQPAAHAAPVDGGAPVGDENAAPEPEPAPQPQPDKRSAQYRFSELTSRARQAEIRAERAEAQLQVYRDLGITPPGHQPQPRPAPMAQAEGPPSPDDYHQGHTDPEYIADVAAYHGRKAFEDAQAQSAQRQEFQSKADRFRGVFSAAEQAAAENPTEFGLAADVLWNLGHSNDHVTCDLITESENHVHLAEWFGRNPQVLQQVQRMPPLQRARAIAQYDFAIGSALRAPALQPAPAPSANAPAPTPAPTPTPIVNGGRTPLAFDPNTASQADFDERLRQIRAARQSQGG